MPDGPLLVAGGQKQAKCRVPRQTRPAAPPPSLKEAAGVMHVIPQADATGSARATECRAVNALWRPQRCS